MKIVDIEHRRQIGGWLNLHGLTGNAVEIGCAFGGYSREVLQQWEGQHYYMVDPWTDQPKDVYREETKGVDFEQYFRDCSKLAEEDKRVTLLREYSVAAATLFKDNFFDFVFVDGNHAAKNVLEDLNAWWPKLKSGGVMGVDDYLNHTTPPHFIEVKKVVDVWMAEKGLTFTVCGRPAAWVVKP